MCVLSYFIIFIFITGSQVLPILSEVSEKTAIGHEGHDYVGSVFVNTDTNQLHHVWVIEIRHLQTLLNQIIQLSSIEHTCYVNVNTISKDMEEMEENYYTIFHVITHFHTI